MSKFFVIDENGFTSFSEKAEAAESFKTLEAANRRARRLAADVPGKHILVARAVLTVTCPVGSPQTREEK